MKVYLTNSPGTYFWSAGREGERGCLEEANEPGCWLCQHHHFSAFFSLFLFSCWARLSCKGPSHVCGATQLSVEPLYTAPSNMLSRSQVLTKDANRWQNCVRTGICRLEFQVLSPPLAGDGKVSKVLRTSKPPCFHLESGSLAASISMLMIGSDVRYFRDSEKSHWFINTFELFQSDYA